MTLLIEKSNQARKKLLECYEPLLEVNPQLNRSLVSYQSNRRRPFYRWFKYKEGFSASLVEYVLGKFATSGQRLLDPFAGTGAASLVARDYGLNSVGIELMPVGAAVFKALLAAEQVNVSKFRDAVSAVEAGEWQKASPSVSFHHLRITDGAFSSTTETNISKYREFCRSLSDNHVRLLLDFACLALLESVSFTRKDGQYLRWDHRAPRKLRGRAFDKGPIPSFAEAISTQVQKMRDDLMRGDLCPTMGVGERGATDFRIGSCLEELPRIDDESVDLVVTSPPYCNRYDYTRTYALELAYAGIDEDELRRLRQSLLSCTVENRSKQDELEAEYKSRQASDLYGRAIAAFDNQHALQEVLDILDAYGREGQLNNSNIPRMVRNYFLESALVVGELSRVVKSGGRVVMVNDNVQYAGEEIPVDLILSDMASSFGFTTETIWVLQRGKGNSSQQMGVHGRNELRKCAYVWYRA